MPTNTKDDRQPCRRTVRTVWLTTAEWAQVKYIATAEKITVGQLLRRAIGRGLKHRPAVLRMPQPGDSLAVAVTVRLGVHDAKDLFKLATRAHSPAEADLLRNAFQIGLHEFSAGTGVPASDEVVKPFVCAAGDPGDNSPRALGHLKRLQLTEMENRELAALAQVTDMAEDEIVAEAYRLGMHELKVETALHRGPHTFTDPPAGLLPAVVPVAGLLNEINIGLADDCPCHQCKPHLDRRVADIAPVDRLTLQLPRDLLREAIDIADLANIALDQVVLHALAAGLYKQTEPVRGVPHGSNETITFSVTLNDVVADHLELQTQLSERLPKEAIACNAIRLGLYSVRVIHAVKQLQRSINWDSSLLSERRIATLFDVTVSDLYDDETLWLAHSDATLGPAVPVSSHPSPAASRAAEIDTLKKTFDALAAETAETRRRLISAEHRMMLREKLRLREQRGDV